MNYELAKKLKEAGFPDSENWIVKDGFILDAEVGYPIPTLSELIEACAANKENVFNLHYYPKRSYGGKWVAYSKGSFVIDGAEPWGHSYAMGDGIAGEGDTAEEAVARLYLQLKLNTK